MRKKKTEKSKRDQEAVGEHQEMSENPATSLRSNTQTSSDSPLIAGNGSNTVMMHFETAESQNLSLNSRNTTFASLSQKNDDDWQPEGEFEMELRVVIKGFGHFEKEERKIATHVAEQLHLAFGKPAFDLYDEIGRKVIWDHTHPERPAFFQDE